jgi:DUF1016 N-terminal domain
MDRVPRPLQDYASIHAGIVDLLRAARSASARYVNSIMTAVYWEIGRRIVESEMRGRRRAEYYGEQLIRRLSAVLMKQFGRGFGSTNLKQMRTFYLTWSEPKIGQTLSDESSNTISPYTIALSSSSIPTATARVPLPWSAYVRLLSVKKPEARAFYEAEALRSGWTVRQLDRQIQSQFYERTALSKNKATMLEKAANAEPGDAMTPEEAIKDPFVLEFLDSLHH